MDIITAIEQAIIARLREKIPEILVESFPDEPESYQLQHHLGAILVRYEGSRYGDPMDSGRVVQERTILFDVDVVVANLSSAGDAGGVYHYLEAVRLALTGFCPPGCTRRLRPVSDAYISRKSHVWQYGILFETRAPAMEVEDEMEGPLLKRITAPDNLGQTTEVT